MLFVHETHEVMGGKMEAFGDAVRTVWRPLLEERGDARLLWFWELTHGTGASYEAISLTAVRDWSAWGALVARADDPRHRAWQRDVCALRKDVIAKILQPAAWSPLATVDLAAVDTPRAASTPALYLHDTGWPFPGRLEVYVEALGRVLHPQETASRMLSVVACLTVAPGAGRHHEVVLLQRVEDWERFMELLRRGEQGAQRGGWMEEGLRYRDRWESKLLRCTAWSPCQ